MSDWDSLVKESAVIDNKQLVRRVQKCLVYSGCNVSKTALCEALADLFDILMQNEILLGHRKAYKPTHYATEKWETLRQANEPRDQVVVLKELIREEDFERPLDIAWLVLKVILAKYPGWPDVSSKNLVLGHSICLYKDWALLLTLERISNNESEQLCTRINKAVSGEWISKMIDALATTTSGSELETVFSGLSINRQPKT